MKDLRTMARYLRPCRWDFFVAILLLLVECGFEMAIPLLMTGIIDDGVALGDVPRIWKLGAAMALCAGLALIAGFIYARFAARAAYRFGGGLREAEYEKLQSFAFSNLDRFSSSSLVTRMTTDVTVMQNAINGGLRPMVRGPVMLLLGIGLSFAMNARLALVFVICTPVLGIILALIVRKVSPLYSRQQTAMDRLNSRIQEGLTGIRAIKAFVRGEYEEERFQEVSQELSDASRTTFQNAVLNLPFFQLVMYSAVVMILWFGGQLILAGEMQVGELTGFLSYVLQVMNSLMMISNVFLLLTRSSSPAPSPAPTASARCWRRPPTRRSRRTRFRRYPTGASTSTACPSSTRRARKNTPCGMWSSTSGRGRRWAFWGAPVRPRAPWFS